MRFLLITHAYPPDPGAASARTSSIAEALKKRGHDVTVLAGRPYYPLGKVPKEYQRRFSRKEGKDVRVWVPALATKGLWRRLVIYAAFTFSYWLALLRYFSVERFDVVYFISPYGLSCFSWPALLHARLNDSIALTDVHDLWPEIITDTASVPGLGLMTKMSAWLADKIIPVSETQKKHLGLDPKKVEVASLAVDTDYFSPTNEHKNTQTIAVAYVGTLAPRYDFATMNEAARILRLDFLVQGDGEQADAVSRMVCLKLERGFSDRDAMLARLRSADILVCPIRDSIEARLTSIPTKVLEYMAVGKPVVCTTNPEIEALGIDTVPFGSSLLLAEKIYWLAKLKEWRDLHGAMNRITCEQRHSLAALGKRIEEICQA